MSNQPKPTHIKVRTKSRVLEISFDNGERFSLPFEYLRVFSPSAEVRGHGGPMLLVYGKENVGVQRVEPVGNYAVRLVFDDGHDTGIFSWPVLHELGQDHDANWKEYLARLEKGGIKRNA